MIKFGFLIFAFNIQISCAQEIEGPRNIQQDFDTITPLLEITKRAKFELNINSIECPTHHLTSLIEGVDEGMKCFEKLNTPLTKSFIVRIEKHFLNSSKKIKFICNKKFEDPDVYALSTYPEDPNYPEISYNLENLSSDLKALGFHEILHLVGYPFVHGFEPDRTNSCESCCFGNKSLDSLECKTCSELPEEEKNYDCSFLLSKYPTIDKRKIYGHTRKQILKSYP